MRNQIRWIACCAGMCILTSTSLAQVYDGVPVPTPGTSDTERREDAAQSKEFFSSKHLVGAHIKDAQGHKLGEISELYINPENSQVFAVVGVSRGRHALVPLQAMEISAARGAFRNAEVTLNKTREQLEAGPLLSNREWQKLDDPEFTGRIYSHYNLQAPASAMGGTDEKALEGRDKGKESKDAGKMEKDSETDSPRVTPLPDRPMP